MELPLEIKRAGSSRTSREGLTRNISSAGVMFALEQHQDPGETIEYVIALPAGENDRVNIRCMGKVVRCEPWPERCYRFRVAATVERYEFVRP